MDSINDTQKHIARVQYYIQIICDELKQRAAKHDASKLQEPEKSGYDVLVFKLADLAYGSDDYRAALEEAGPVIQHHYQCNRHHPEHYDSGINGMSLIDIIEMFCDWRAASERTKQGSIYQSLEVNQRRFMIDDQLISIFSNTCKELGW